MTIFQAVVYGIIQGLGEFLPISSSAHLVVTPWLFGWKDPGLTFDIALHLGTLVAVILFFWKDWIRLVTAGLKGAKNTDGKLFWFLVIATIPGGIAGVLLEKKAEHLFRNPALIGATLIIMGIILYYADKFGKKKDHIENIGFVRSLLIGLSQALAVIPGVSRSGITMSTGLIGGLSRESAAKFSFLLSTPIIVGAGLMKIKDMLHSTIQTAPFITAVITSAVVGFLSIKFLLDYLKNKSFDIFVIYRLIVGVVLIAIYVLR